MPSDIEVFLNRVQAPQPDLNAMAEAVFADLTARAG